MMGSILLRDGFLGLSFLLENYASSLVTRVETTEKHREVGCKFDEVHRYIENYIQKCRTKILVLIETRRKEGELTIRPISFVMGFISNNFHFILYD